MDFKDVIKQLADKFERLKDNIQTEEATKNAFVMPFITALGYDVFNPVEVVPEFTCDIGTKKGEKIDYAIIKDNEPIILMECKHWGQSLTLNDNQLLRYFHVSKAKFGILTNGMVYKFYTDLEMPNKMDEKPFLEVNLTDLKDFQVDELKKFHKSYFNVDAIFSSASELKYTSALKSIIGIEFQTPGPELVKLLSKQVYDGPITAKMLEQFTGLVKKSISFYVNDIINDRLKSALKVTQESDNITQEEPLIAETKEDKIVTTEDELEGYIIIKSIIRQVIEVKRIVYRDSQSYFTIIIDDNNRKPICKLYLHNAKKFISFTDDDKKEQKHEIKTLDDIFIHTLALLKLAEKYKL